MLYSAYVKICLTYRTNILYAPLECSEFIAIKVNLNPGVLFSAFSHVFVLIPFPRIDMYMYTFVTKREIYACVCTRVINGLI